MNNQDKADADKLFAKLSSYVDTPTLYSVMHERLVDLTKTKLAGRPTVATIKDVLKRLPKPSDQ